MMITKIFLGWSRTSMLLTLVMERIMRMRRAQTRAVYYVRSNATAFHLVS
jgi:hypothetical protein